VQSSLATATAPTVTPRPFIKWVGGKRQLLPAIERLVPKTYRAYHEPFLGGAALFFHLLPQRAYLTDLNERLIRTYRGVRDACEKVIRLLRSYPHEKEFFLRFRAIDIDAASDAEVAAWFIYLNRTAYNGLYRVNRRNVFNVPFGNYTNPTICDVETLRACSLALRGVALEKSDFARVLDRASEGDFVYFDPPYVPRSVTSSFTSYTSDGFGMDEQRKLRDIARTLKHRGVHVLVSNSSATAVRELYEDFEQMEVGASRMVNCKADGRGKVTELLIR
jgi:DNA adenine methylase